MASISQSAAERGVDLLFFPVTVLTGPLPVDLGEQDAFLDDLAETLAELSPRVSCNCLVPVVSMVGDYPYAEALLLSGGRVIPQRFGSWPLSPARIPLREGGHGEQGLARFEAAGSQIGLAFSYEDLDVWCERPREVDVICYLASFGFAVDDPSSALGSALGEGRYVRDAQDSGAWIVGVGPVGGYGTQVFSGSSFVLAPDGRLVSSAASFEEDLLVADVGNGVELGSGAEVQPELYDVRYHLWQALVLGIHDFVWKLGKRGVALALDGSLSSMLSAVLATDALGPTNVHVLLASQGHPDRIAEVSRLARALRLDAQPLSDLGTDDQLFVRDLVEVHLAALARMHDVVALSCRDKTSFALESSALSVNGALFAPLGDLYRIDVLDVARLRNTISQVLPSLEVTPSDIPDVGIDVPQWGCETLLERMDTVLSTHVEGGRSLTETAEAVGDAEVTTAVLGALRDCEAQRMSCPPCLMLTTRTLLDAHMPLGFAWRDHLRPEGTAHRRVNREMAFREETNRPSNAEAYGRRSIEDDILRDGEFQEALELLRDLALGSRDEWQNTFSEN